MNSINGIPFNAFPFDKLSKVSDLMEYDGPILSHYSNGNKGYLFFWVDYNETHNRWLIFEIDNSSLYSYLKKESTLEELVNESLIFYTVDIDENLNYQNCQLLTFNQLPIDYIPEEDSYYNFDIPEVYGSISDNQNKYNTLNPSLHSNSLTYKIEPKTPKHSGFVKTDEAAVFLQNLTKSSQSYAENDFFQKFKNNFRSVDEANKLNKDVRILSTPLITASKINSFEVELSYNTVMEMTTTVNSYNDWKQSLHENFYNDVIDVDYSSEEINEILASRFPDEGIRSKIVKPILDILSSNKYKFSTSGTNKIKKVHKNITTKKRSEIIPSSNTLQNEDEYSKEIVTLTTEVKKDKFGKIVSNKKEIIEDNALFSKVEKQVILALESFGNGDNDFYFNKPLNYKNEITFDNKTKISVDEFSIEVVDENRKKALKKFHVALGQKILNNAANIVELYGIEIE